MIKVMEPLSSESHCRKFLLLLLLLAVAGVRSEGRRPENWNEPSSKKLSQWLGPR